MPIKYIRALPDHADDNDENDDDVVVRHGESVSVPMLLTDRLPKPPRASRPLIVDAFGAQAGHRPGFIFATDTSAKRAAETAYEERGRILRDMWRDEPDRRMTNSVDDEWEAKGKRQREAWRNPPTVVRPHRQPTPLVAGAPFAAHRPSPSGPLTSPPVGRSDGFKSDLDRLAFEESSRARAEAWRNA